MGFESLSQQKKPGMTLAQVWEEVFRLTSAMEKPNEAPTKADVERMAALKRSRQYLICQLRRLRDVRQSPPSAYLVEVAKNGNPTPLREILRGFQVYAKQLRREIKTARYIGPQETKS